MDAFFRTLPGVFDVIDASDEVRNAFVFAAWRRVAGGQIVERTAPFDVVEKRLVIAVADKTWQRNLETLASQLVFKLNATLGRPMVNFIEFRIMPDVINASSESVRSGTDEDLSLPSEIAASADAIGNEKLRNTVLKAAANCLARPR